MRDLLPIELFEIMTHIKYGGHISYLVGGSVRDYMIGNTPKDFDIVTDMPVDNLIPVLIENDWVINEAGKQFLVLIATKGGMQFEIAQFRKDGSYTDGRRPDSVEIGTIEEDAERRDLTINSLYYDPYNDLVIDPTGNGINDINNKIIRMNGSPERRIKEDLLRIMRVYRFAGTLGFVIHKKTLVACRTHFSDMCIKIPGARIINEVEKMI